MTGQWHDLERELHLSRADAHTHGHDWDVRDAVEAVARWIGIPAPRQSPDDLLTQVLHTGPRCICGRHL